MVTASTIETTLARSISGNASLILTPSGRSVEAAATSDPGGTHPPRRLQAILNATSAGLVLHDSAGAIVAANSRAADLLGFALHTLSSESPAILQADLQARSARPETFSACWRSHLAASDRVHEDELLLLRPRRVVLRRHSSPLLDRGEPYWRVFTYTDITTERNLELLKSEFVSLASHELRTPLTSVHGALQLALAASGRFLAPEDRELLDISLASTTRLIRLVDDLLDLSKIEAGRLPMNPVLVPAADLVRAAVESMTGLSLLRGIRLTSDSPPDLPPVMVDADQIVRVLSNLLSNAVKYSPEDSTVHVAVRRGHAHLDISVEDEGPGIPSDQIDRLFQPFCRVGAEEREMTGGTGLGLAIARAIVVQHGGRIQMEPVDPHGCRFVVRLPMTSGG